MRLIFLFAVLALLCATVFAWEKEDHEIFDLVGALEKAEGKGTTFYSWLDIPSTASVSQISKAYRKKSIEMHPDKNPGVKGIHDRFARLGVIAGILRNAEQRKRYDFFYKNGVPKWRGTGYYYDRFRPGLGTVLTFLVLLTSGLHYLIMGIQYKTDLARVERFIGEAKAAAWGPKMIPIEGRRKVRVALGGQARVDEDGNVLAGRSIDMMVDGNGSVFIVEPNGGLEPLDASAATPPAWSRTWFAALASSLFAKATGKASAASSTTNGDAEDDAESELGTDSTPGTPNSESAANTGSGAHKAGAQATTKAGGKRRKVVKRK